MFTNQKIYVYTEVGKKTQKKYKRTYKTKEKAKKSLKSSRKLKKRGSRRLPFRMKDVSISMYTPSGKGGTKDYDSNLTLSGVIEDFRKEGAIPPENEDMVDIFVIVDGYKTLLVDPELSLGEMVKRDIFLPDDIVYVGRGKISEKIVELKLDNPPPMVDGTINIIGNWGQSNRIVVLVNLKTPYITLTGDTKHWIPFYLSTSTNIIGSKRDFLPFFGENDFVPKDMREIKNIFEMARPLIPKGSKKI